MKTELALIWKNENSPAHWVTIWRSWSKWLNSKWFNVRTVIRSVTVRLNVDSSYEHRRKIRSRLAARAALPVEMIIAHDLLKHLLLGSKITRDTCLQDMVEFLYIETQKFMRNQRSDVHSTDSKRFRQVCSAGTDDRRSALRRSRAVFGAQTWCFGRN